MANIINKRIINDSDIVKLIEINDELRIVHNSFNNRVNRMRKIDKYHGVNTETGEIIQFNCSENRSQRMCDFKRSLSNLRDIIKHNVVELEKCFFITLTYDDNISDREVFRKDFDYFIRRFRDHFGICEYIKPIEYQGRGAIHCHLIVIFDKVPTFIITSKDIKKYWKHGSVDIGPITSAEATAKYLTNFLFEYTESNNDLDYWFKSKKQKKGERTIFYKPHEKLYSCSQKIKRPKKFANITYSEAKNKFDTIELKSSLSIYNDDGNIVTVENYKIINGKEVC